MGLAVLALLRAARRGPQPRFAPSPPSTTSARLPSQAHD